jgi:hypothetical protein
MPNYLEPLVRLKNVRCNSNRISTSMPVVNMMGIADPYLDFDDRDFSITLDSAAKALK